MMNSLRVLGFVAFLSVALSGMAMSDLIGYWEFEGSGATAVDDSGNDYHGVLSGGATLSNGVLALDGSGHVEITGSEPANHPLSLVGTSYTIAIRVMLDAGTGSRIVQKEEGDDFSGGYAVMYGAAHVSGMGVTQNPVGGNHGTGYSPPEGEWFTFIVVYNSATSTIDAYVQDETNYTSPTLIDSWGAGDLAADGDDPLWFGAIPVYGQNMRGKVDYVGIWNDALPESDVIAVFARGPNFASCKAIVPHPAPNAIDVDIEGVTLTWYAGDCNDVPLLEHDVYFGPNDVGMEYLGTVTEAVYPLYSLDPGTVYMWRIDEVYPNETVTGDVWRFTTRLIEQPVLLTPKDKAVVPVDHVLMWTSADFTDREYVYLGTDPNAVQAATPDSPLMVSNGPSPFTPTLVAHITYYWRVEASRSGGLGDATSEMGSFTARAPIEDYLLGWWRFDEENGTVAADSSGNGYNGVLGGSPLRDSGKLIMNAPDYVEITGSEPAEHPLSLVDTGYTVMARIKKTAAGLNRIINKDDGEDLSGGYSMLGDGRWMHLGETTLGGLTPPLDEWVTMVYAYEAGTGDMTAYIKNEAADPVIQKIITANDPVPLTADGDDPLWFGAIPVYGQNFNGAMDYVAIYNAAITESELVSTLSGLETTCWASDPDPANGAADVNPRDRVFTWRPGSVTCELGDFVEHRVWFGPADTGLVDQGGTMVPEFAPGNLLPQEYVWRVDEVYTGGTQQGTEWHFTVRELSCQDVIDAGLLLSADLSGPLGVPDCHVNLYDLAAFVGQWLECNDPSDDTCLFPF